MTWPIQPLGPRSADPSGVAPIDRARKVRDREPRDEDERRQRGQHEQPAPEPDGPPVADADGHIDVLA
jgi:hypothetical protein